MKKYLILSIFFLAVLVNNVQSQEKEYGPWTTSSCFKGIDYSVKKLENGKWNVRFRNRYHENVWFNCGANAYNEVCKITDRIKVLSGQTNWTYFIINSDNINICIGELKFRKDDWSAPNEKCDNN